MQYEDFYISLSNNSTISCSYHKEKKEGKLSLTFKKGEIEAASNPILAETYTKGGIKDIGERLAEALFSKEITNLFEDALHNIEAKDRSAGLRILLKADSNYVDYPWEIMYRDKIPMATSIRTPLIRIYDGGSTLPINITNNKDKIPNLLVIASNVVGLTAVDISGELKIINDNTEPYRKQIHKHIVDIATRTEIEKKLTNESLIGNPINIVQIL